MTHIKKQEVGWHNVTILMVCNDLIKRIYINDFFDKIFT